MGMVSMAVGAAVEATGGGAEAGLQVAEGLEVAEAVEAPRAVRV